MNVGDISIIKQPQYKRISELQNTAYKDIKIHDKIKYLKRLLEINQDNLTFCIEEVKSIIDDIGNDLIKQEIETDVFTLLDERKIVRIA